LMAATVDGLHDARAATGDDGEPTPCQRVPKLDPGAVVGVVGVRSGRAEHSDGRPHLVERVEPFDELGKDPQNAPGVGVVTELFDRAALEQSAVGRDVLRRQDQAPGAPAVTHVPAAHLTHQACSVSPLAGRSSVEAGAGGVSGSRTASLVSEARLRAFFSLSPPLTIAGSGRAGGATASITTESAMKIGRAHV